MILIMCFKRHLLFSFTKKFCLVVNKVWQFHNVSTHENFQSTILLCNMTMLATSSKYNFKFNPTQKRETKVGGDLLKFFLESPPVPRLWGSKNGNTLRVLPPCFQISWKTIKTLKAFCGKAPHQYCWSITSY